MQFSLDIKIKAITELANGLGVSNIMRKYGISGSATIYEWQRHFIELGMAGLASNSSTKTYRDYSFKMKVINWHMKTKSSLTEAAHHFHIRHPSLIWSWEKALVTGQGVLR